MHHEKAVDLIRTYQTIVGGCCAGVLGLTGLAGAVLYIVIYLAISVGYASTKKRPSATASAALATVFTSPRPLPRPPLTRH